MMREQERVLEYHHGLQKKCLTEVDATVKNVQRGLNQNFEGYEMRDVWYEKCVWRRWNIASSSFGKIFIRPSGSLYIF